MDGNDANQDYRHILAFYLMYEYNIERYVWWSGLKFVSLHFDTNIYKISLMIIVIHFHTYLNRHHFCYFTFFVLLVHHF